MSILIAIDPGKNGGLAYQRSGEPLQVASMPDTAHDLARLLTYIVGPFAESDCVVERVHSMPHDSGRAAFSFGENFGMIQGALAALGIPYRFVTPQQWQRKIGALPADKPGRKRAIKAWVQQRNPNLKITLKTADAAAMLSVMRENNERHN